MPIDVYRPAGKTPKIILLHPGGWRERSKNMVAEEGAELAGQRFIVFAPACRLLDEAAWPAQIQDVKAAIRWVRERSVKYGLDPSKIANARLTDCNGLAAPGEQVSIPGGTEGAAAGEADTVWVKIERRCQTAKRSAMRRRALCR